MRGMKVTTWYWPHNFKTASLVDMHGKAAVQGFLTHKKTHSPRNLPKAYA